MSTPTGDNAFLHERELNVRAELTVAVVTGVLLLPFFRRQWPPHLSRLIQDLRTRIAWDRSRRARARRLAPRTSLPIRGPFSAFRVRSSWRRDASDGRIPAAPIPPRPGWSARCA
jgi:hypothetical protein